MGHVSTQARYLKTQNFHLSLQCFAKVFHSKHSLLAVEQLSDFLARIVRVNTSTNSLELKHDSFLILDIEQHSLDRERV